MVRRRKVSTFVDPDADTTDCHECGAEITIADDEQVMAAIVRHYQEAHDMLTVDE